MTHIDARLARDLTGLRITDLSLYQTAFRHKSVGNRSNERLEFIGDAVLNLVVTRYLYDAFPNEDEGFLTKTRIRIVNGTTLARIARNMNLDKYIEMSEKGKRHGWNANSRILEDVFEALIGAIYLDLNFSATYDFVHRCLLSKLSQADVLQDTNYKDCLIKWAKHEASELEYILVDDQGEGDHRFRVDLKFKGTFLATGRGRVKKEAEQNAAYQAVRGLGILETVA